MVKENTSLEYEKAINYIYKMIEEEELSLGSKLPTERSISEKLGIGRNSTREALSILHGMGMIERKQGSGNYISKNVGNSIKQILMMMLALGTITKKDVCEFRRTMEKSVAMLLVDRGISKEDKKILQGLLERMEKAKGKELVEIDRKFHYSLIIATKNTLFITIMEAVNEIYREWIDIALKKADEENKERLLKYHKDIFGNILVKNTEEMITSIDKHYDLIEKML